MRRHRGRGHVGGRRRGQPQPDACDERAGQHGPAAQVRQQAAAPHQQEAQPDDEEPRGDHPGRLVAQQQPLGDGGHDQERHRIDQQHQAGGSGVQAHAGAEVEGQIDHEGPVAAVHADAGEDAAREVADREHGEVEHRVGLAALHRDECREAGGGQGGQAEGGRALPAETFALHE